MNSTLLIDDEIFQVNPFLIFSGEIKQVKDQ